MYALPLIWWMSLTPPWTASTYARVAAMSMATFTLLGCGHTTPVTITKVEYVKVYVDTSLTRAVSVEPAPEPQSYMALSLPEREQVLTYYSIGLMKNIAQCNAQLYKIKQVYGEKTR